MTWINFLHLYQPANADAYVIKEATNLSYLRIITALEKNPHIKFNLNINGCLFSRWNELGYHDLIKRLNALLSRQQITITGTAAYHPLLPLIPEKEIKRQIKENEQIIKKYLGNFKPSGFFLPEMAYGVKAAKLIKQAGYKWIILDEIAYKGKLNQVDYNKIYQDKNNGLKIIFRNRSLSGSYIPETMLTLMEKKTSAPNTIITAADGELYGLRHHDEEKKFEQLLKRKSLKTLIISEYIKGKPTKLIKPRPSSWESTEEEIKNKLPYALWYNPRNNIQKKIWSLAKLAYETAEKNSHDYNYHWSRWHLVRGLASCTFWWASGRDFSPVFGPISWNPDEIERGINEFIRSIRSLENTTTRPVKMRGEKLYLKIKQLVWNKHWNYYWRKK